MTWSWRSGGRRDIGWVEWNKSY